MEDLVETEAFSQMKVWVKGLELTFLNKIWIIGLL
jgi:hypothetical protein